MPIPEVVTIASHLIFTAHGFWLPNDPRGSWSTSVRSYALYRAAGPATTTSTRQSVAHAEHDRTQRLRAKAALRYPPVRLTPEQGREVVRGLKQAVEESAYAVFALAVMPDHVHPVVADHTTPPARVIGHFKTRATQALLAAGLHPFASSVRPNGRVPEVWAHRAWKVFLDTPDQVRRAVRYVEQNPIRAGLRAQRYSFLTPFETWHR